MSADTSAVLIFLYKLTDAITLVSSKPRCDDHSCAPHRLKLLFKLMFGFVLDGVQLSQ